MFFVGYVSEYGNVVRFSNFFDTKAAAKKKLAELESNSMLDMIDFHIFAK